MSLVQIEQEITSLTPGELEHLQAVINALRKRTKVTATPEMLAERQRLTAQVMKGEWGTDLPPWQETRALDQAKDPWNT